MKNKLTLLQHMRSLALYMKKTIGTSAQAAADAIEDLEKAIPTKTSELINDSGFIKDLSEKEFAELNNLLSGS